MSVKITIVPHERDLDMFFLEEVVANISFRGWFLSQIGGWPPEFDKLISAQRSSAHETGEVDLRFTFEDAAGNRAQVIAENKIDAPFQPEQLQRYREHASNLIKRGDLLRVMVVLLAPSGYVSRLRTQDEEAKSEAVEHRPFRDVDAHVSYEAVGRWLHARKRTERVAYKRQLVKSAIAKYELGYRPEPHGPVTDFWQSYWAEARSIAPEVGMDDPGVKPRKAGFVRFRRDDLPSGLTLLHKLPRSRVDLQFPSLGSRVGELAGALAPFLDAEMKVERASKSAAVRISVPRIVTELPFANQIEEVHLGIRAAKKLRAWALKHSARIDGILAGLSSD
jgi:hypothetical protein